MHLDRLLGEIELEGGNVDEEDIKIIVSRPTRLLGINKKMTFHYAIPTTMKRKPLKMCRLDYRFTENIINSLSILDPFYRGEKNMYQTIGVTNLDVEKQLVQKHQK